MKLVRLSALVAIFGTALVMSFGREAQAQGISPIDTYFCMCGCPDGTIVCLEDDSPDCGVCATACDPYSGV
jgi:hypothetical protein